ncbi:uncharacterized protein L3040_009549 [Drepanopeziza brunnea f. sp. 'multigermtubi']|uniref:uncharacterized protein n=1 Tax=Drepanopeziza brunnea f. sp. 'multigermtubi' TaxID=698441 RepID=UPI00238839FC|nr:hypothetical protein L3040_009549 [Drepanopeziza brunnea f. sp. 'multigermtubi']
MSFGNFYHDEDHMAMYDMLQRGGGMRGAPKRFDEYYRCYPTVMLPGPEREELNYGGKIIMPASALDKLTRLHITYPMLFELTNGLKGDRTTHCGVLEFIAEEGKVYLPHWMMQTLLVETGDLIQIRSTDLAPARFIKVQAQDVNFLEVSDPKAVLERAFRNFATMTKGDVFSFKYNDETYDMAVLEVKPESGKGAVCVIETDVEVDFAAPLGYVEPQPTRGSGTSTPKSVAGLPAGGMMHSQGTMAQSINYDAIAPSSNAAVLGAKAVSSNFLLGGQKLNAKKSSKNPTPKPSTPVQGTSTNPPVPATAVRRTNGPLPLRLAPNKLFFGYEIKPLKTQEDKDKENSAALQPRFEGQGYTLKGGLKRKTEEKAPTQIKEEKKEPSVGRRLDGRNV